MRLFTTLLLFVSTCLPIASYAKETITIGTKVTFESKVLGEKRNIAIYAPKGEQPDQPYHVIYLLDSEVHFHTVSGIVKSLIDYEQIPNTLLVGIETVNRAQYFLPKIEGEPKTQFQQFVASKWPNSGQTDKYLNFLEKELFQYIENQYKVHPHRTLIGHSNGGTLALYTLFNHPQLFQNYLAISPNGWWSHEEMVTNVEKLAKDGRPKEKLYVTVAGEGGRFYSGTMDLLANLELNKPKQLNWHFEHFPDYSHMSGILPAVSAGLEHLYGDLNFKVTPEFARYSSVSALQTHYQGLSKDYGFEVRIPVDAYVELAHQQQSNDRKLQALETLTQFVNQHPEMPYAHMRYAQGLMTLNRFEEAVLSFETALDFAKKQSREAGIIDALQDMVNDAKSKT